MRLNRIQNFWCLYRFFRFWPGRDEFTNVSSITSLRRRCLRGWVLFTLDSHFCSGEVYNILTVWVLIPGQLFKKLKKRPLRHVLWRWRWLCVLSAARRWPPGRSSSLRTTRWATRWPEPASRTWGNTAAAQTPACPEPEKPVCPTCCSVWSLLCIEVIAPSRQLLSSPHANPGVAISWIIFQWLVCSHK